MCVPVLSGGGPTTGANATIDIGFFDAYAPTVAGTYMGHDSVATVTTLANNAFVSREVVIYKRTNVFGAWVYLPAPGGWSDTVPQGPTTTITYTDPPAGAYVGPALAVGQYMAVLRVGASSMTGSTEAFSISYFNI